ncbi:T6SS effector amidase Tae4 family protein [Pseudobacteriovorax antillogorgiicola]|uniref:Type VI secretion system (T6SS), amidase effector protein 4 n=1 Tax=Pseudobacteriovorax antillogorgiicola TaxID=1513793 RepID=A0A1Y6BHB5_9BACT|nr:T6SS effector amidase Tae4 family protein [Pseudobacteriovorax antillogorgiicola]TCS57409.1 type VI secretion system (T6SS) effector Tae4 (amidase) [Pseudobacteriovorax antillogorgiicola]SMF01481.1 Type VI secretion system (T6SS), amidase effector protein 4 [Pseudobacteriovorax antillogorgiicola]
MKRILLGMIVGASALLGGCGHEDDSDLDSIPRDLVTCLKGGSCAGYVVKASSGSKNFNHVFSSLWTNYPSGSSSQVKEDIGGNVDADWITNTCVVRTSRALNYSGSAFEIPLNFEPYNGMNTIRGGDGKRYGFRVVEMAQYMLAKYGRPQVRSAAAAIGRKGIILFDREGWNDANGHFDIWNGSSAKYSDYTSESTNVFVWE